MSSRPFFSRVACCVAAALPLALSSAAAESAADSANAGRALVKRYADAIVGVELVATMKVKVGERELPPREQKIQANGTVISASGLTVTSLAAVDPQESFDAIRARVNGGRAPELVGVDYKEVKLRLADGKEVPAKFVLKDADLDLAFMAPEEGADAAKRDFSFVKLDDSGEGQLLATYFIVARAPKILQRVPIVRQTTVAGIVERPRRLYLVTDPVVGTPAFDSEGRVLGINVQYFSSGQRAPVVLPAADVAESAKQAAAQASAPAPKTEQPESK